MTGINEDSWVYNSFKRYSKMNIGFNEGEAQEAAETVIGLSAMIIKYNPVMLSLRASNAVNGAITAIHDTMNQKGKALKDTQEIVNNPDDNNNVITQSIDYAKEVVDDPYKTGNLLGRATFFVASLFVGAGETKVLSMAEKGASKAGVLTKLSKAGANLADEATDAINLISKGGVETAETVAKKPHMKFDLQLFAKKDIKQIQDIAKQFKMDDVARRGFGDYVESLKDLVPNNKNFTYKELEEIAKEFLGVK